MSAESDFDRLVASIDYPMVVVTAAAGNERAGCLAGFTTQCSIDPPRWIVCISQNNRTHAVARHAPVFVVHVLRASQHDLAELFGSQSGDDVDKFDLCAWSPGPKDTPVLDDTDWFAGRVGHRHDMGDHTGFVLDVLSAGSSHRSGQPQLGFHAVRDIDPGHEA